MMLVPLILCITNGCCQQSLTFYNIRFASTNNFTCRAVATCNHATITLNIKSLVVCKHSVTTHVLHLLTNLFPERTCQTIEQLQTCERETKKINFRKRKKSTNKKTESKQGEVGSRFIQRSTVSRIYKSSLLRYVVLPLFLSKNKIAAIIQRCKNTR